MTSENFSTLRKIKCYFWMDKILNDDLSLAYDAVSFKN